MVMKHVFYFGRERPKFQIKEDGETPRNGTKALGEASGTVKVTRDSKVDDTVRVRLVPCVTCSYVSVDMLNCCLRGVCAYAVVKEKL